MAAEASDFLAGRNAEQADFPALGIGYRQRLAVPREPEGDGAFFRPFNYTDHFALGGIPQANPLSLEIPDAG
jgi:hypothetical protein